MKKLNQKGFAIASILYSIMVLFLMLLLGILGILGSRKATLDKNKKDIINSLNHAYLVDKFIFEHRNITIVNNGNKDDIVFALMDGVKAIDKDGNEIGKEFIKYDLDINNIENRAYNVTYTANNGGKTIVGTRIITFTSETNIKTFSYTGDVQTFIVPSDGKYRLETWGAQGGTDSSTYHGGYGAYSYGHMNFDKNQKIYVFVGGKGPTNNSYSQTGTVYGYPNGGAVYSGGGSQYKIIYAAGGGSTHLSFVNQELKNITGSDIIIVAAGGGGSCSWWNYGDNGGNGGGYVGSSTTYNYPNKGSINNSTGGTQSSGGNGGGNLDGHSANSWMNGLYGIGGGTKITPSTYISGGGGGGYYGGGASWGGSGAGGSSYIGNSQLSTKAMYCYECAISMEENIKTISNSCVNSSPVEKCSKIGDGYAKISLIYYY